MTAVLAIDVGSTMARAVVFAEDGSTRDRTLVRRLHGGLHDADALAAEVEALVADCRRQAPAVDAVACSCFWHSMLPLDERGRPLTPLLHWRDPGAADAADELRRRLDPEAVHRRTGCPLHPSYWPAKLAWLRAERPEAFAVAARFVSFGEYLYARLVGRSPMSLSMASGTGLLGLATGTWDEELLDALGLGRERLPEVSDEPVGEREPWFPPLGDGACANVGVGAVTRERAAVTIGTSAAFRTAYEAPPPEPRPGLFLYRLDHRRVVEGGSLSDGGNLYYWLLRLLRLPDGTRLDEAGPDAHGLTFLALLGGERAPGWDARAKGGISGLTFDTEPQDVLRAGLEGVALRLSLVAERMPEVEEVVVSGGAMASDPVWLQLLADALDRRVLRSRAVEASARGAAVVALERLGFAPPPASVGAAFEPRPERVALLRAARERQQELYEALRGERRPERS